MDMSMIGAAGGAPYTHRGTRAVLRMVEFAPSTGGLALWAHHRDVDLLSGPGRALVATDGYTIYYGPLFEGLGLAEQTGLVAHEVLHVALRHPQRLAALQRLLGDVDAQLFNLCADAIVNSALAHVPWLSLPKGSLLLGPLLSGALGLGQDAERALLEWDVERLYRAIDDRRPAQQGAQQQELGGGAGSGQQGQGSGRGSDGERGQEVRREDGPRAAKARALGKGSLADLLPAQGTELLPETEAEQAREWSERLVRAHAGDGAHSMLRALLADLPRSRTPWEQVLRTLLAHGLSPRPGVSWSRPSRSYLANQGRAGPHRRMPWEPGTSAVKSVPKLAVLVDVSGSIDPALVARFAREVEAIARRLEAGLTLIVGDDRVRRVEQFAPGEADLSGLSVQGGGGTDFTPLLEEAELHRPDLAVFLTDLDGPARLRPRWPVIWAVPEASALLPPPFGRKVLLR